MNEAELLHRIWWALKCRNPDWCSAELNDKDIVFSKGGDVFRISVEQTGHGPHEPEPKDNRDVHTEHCEYDGCKYGQDDECPVYLGLKRPTHLIDEFGRVSQRPTDDEFKKRRSGRLF